MASDKEYAEGIINRYVYAVSKRLAGSQRGDIERELRGLIDDMLLARCGDNEPSAKDIDQVLTELGAPETLAAKYNGQQRYLIGPEYYGTFRFVLPLVLGCVAFGLSIAYAIQVLTAEEGNPLKSILGYVTGLYSALMQAFAMVTIGFALAERFVREKKGIKLSGVWEPSMLPELPQATKGLSKGDAIAGLVFGAILLVLLNAAPQVFGLYAFREGYIIVPVFDLVRLQSAMVWINLCIALGISRDAVKLIAGRYSPWMAAVTALINVATLAITFAIFGDGTIWNANFTSQLSGSGVETPEFMSKMFWGGFSRIFLAAVVLGFMVDTVTLIVRTVKTQLSAGVPS